MTLIFTNFDDKVSTSIFMASLPESWNDIINVVSGSAVKNKLKLGDVQEQILNKKILRRELDLVS